MLSQNPGNGSFGIDIDFEDRDTESGFYRIYLTYSNLNDVFTADVCLMKFGHGLFD